MEGDIQTAAEVLDAMKQIGVEIDKGHITSAIRACWEAKGAAHNAAAYLFQLLLDLELQPDIAIFTCLVGAYRTAPVEKVVGAYKDMQSMNIKADFAFAEIYLGTLLLKPKVQKFNQKEMTDWVRAVPAPRIAAAKAALKDFERESLKLTSLSKAFAKALQQM